MATTLIAGTGASSTSVNATDFVPPNGYVAWANPSNITANDGALSTVTFGGGAISQVSQTLIASNFGFAIPGGATINGVSVVIEASTTGTYGAFEGPVHMYLNGVITDHDKGDTGASWTGNRSYGSGADVWGQALTPALINASNFGITMVVAPLIIGSNQQACTGSVDHVTVTVYYDITVPGVTTQSFTAVSSTRATANGTITSTGGADCDIRGFVYGTETRSLPGNVAPAASGYAYSDSVTGTFIAESYSNVLNGLATSTTFYARAYAHNSTGYSYGSEVSFTTLNATTSAFVNEDPTVMVETMLDTYGPLGGSISYTDPSTELTGLVLDYTFNTNTILEGIQACLSLAPSGFYYAVNLGTGVLSFKSSSTTADYTLVKGLHIEKLTLVSSIEEVKNKVYFSGGDVGGGVNLYKVYEDSDSVDAFGQRLGRMSNNRVTGNDEADAIGESEIALKSDEQYQTSVTILDSTMDITLFQPGETVGFSNFGSFVDDLILVIVRVEYSPEEVRLTLGTLPTQLNLEFEQIRRGLIAEQTVANPSTPS